MKLNERSVAHYATCDSPPDKTGFLSKRGERNTAYHRRWFVLKGNMLFYFEERNSREPIGVIVLEGCTVELCDSAEEFAFAIKFDCAKARAYKLIAENQAAMESWVKALSRASFDYMRLVVRELERQLEEIQEAAGGGVVDTQQGKLKSNPRNQAAQPRSTAPFSSSPAPSLTTSSSAPCVTGQETTRRSHWEEAPLVTGYSRENGVTWTKPPATAANGSAEGIQSCAVWEGCSDSSTGCSEGRVPPVPPRRRGASLESPVCPGTGCFSKLHNWYGEEVMELRQEWLQSQ